MRLIKRALFIALGLVFMAVAFGLLLFNRTLDWWSCVGLTLLNTSGALLFLWVGIKGANQTIDEIDPPLP